jgi:hypothetical protein
LRGAKKDHQSLQENENAMPFMSEAEKQELLVIMVNQLKNGAGTREDFLRTKLEVDSSLIQLRAAEAEEKAAIASERAADASGRNAKYMLWSVGLAALSALISLVSTLSANWPKK